MDKYLPLILVSFLAAFLTTPLAGRVAHKAGFVDEPRPHKVHIRPIPLLGGVAIYLALAVALVIALLQSKIDIFLPELLAVVAGSTLLLLVGLWDDRHGMEPRIKLLTQCAAAVMLVLAGVRVDLFPWAAVNILVTIFWVVGITNAINLMDNMDGLAAGVSAVAALFFTLLAATSRQGLIAGLASAVTGASLGFLYYNISPAMVFMGDTGSLLLGYLLAFIGIRYSPEALPLGSTWMVPIVVLGLPIFDTTLVTYARLRSHRPISQGGTDHTSHRLAQLGLGQNRSVITMYLAAGMLGSLAVLMTQSGAETATLLFLGLLIVGLAGVLWLGGKRALPPVDPLIVILAEDDQASQAIRAARRISSNLCVILSPDCSAAMAGKILEEMAWSGDSFRQWRKNTGETATGLVKNWSDVFRLTGTIHSNPDLPPERLEELFRDGRVVIRCRGKGWPSEVEAALARVRKKTLLAPDGKDALPIAEWNDPIKLGERLEEAAMGISRNGDKK